MREGPGTAPAAGQCGVVGERPLGQAARSGPLFQGHLFPGLLQGLEKGMYVRGLEQCLKLVHH